MAEPEQPVPARQGRTILIVDDDRGVVDTFSRMLKLQGFSVETALTAEAGLELAAARRPDAIILDLRMPLQNGVAFLRSLRADPQHLRTPVAVVTGDYFLDDDLSAELKRLGATIRFKPLWLNDLVSLTRELLP